VRSNPRSRKIKNPAEEASGRARSSPGLFGVKPSRWCAKKRALDATLQRPPRRPSPGEALPAPPRSGWFVVEPSFEDGSKQTLMPAAAQRVISETRHMLLAVNARQAAGKPRALPRPSCEKTRFCRKKREGHQTAGGEGREPPRGCSPGIFFSTVLPLPSAWANNRLFPPLPAKTKPCDRPRRPHPALRLALINPLPSTERRAQETTSDHPEPT